MGKRRRFRFPKSIKPHNRYYYPDRREDPDFYEATNKVTDLFLNDRTSFTDPLGSYTGVPLDESDIPLQDVDDL